METLPARRPRVARETRLLISVALLAVVALWALARLRFPERSPAQQVVPPILAPLVARQGFTGLESQLSDSTSRISPSLSAIAVAAADGSSRRYAAAVRLHDEVAVLLAPEGTIPIDGMSGVVARDVTGLAVLRLSPGPAAPVALSWFRRDLAVSRYLLQTSASEAGVSLAPALVGGLVPEDAPLWAGQVWRTSVASGLTPGAVVFTLDGEWIGVAVLHGGRPVIVPADVVARLAEAHLSRAPAGAMTVGIEVQAMDASLRDLLAFPHGVVVTWVDPDGPARETLRVGDVVHGADGRPVPTLDHWRRHLADLGPRTTNLTVWRDNTSTAVAVTPVPIPPRAAEPARAVGNRLLGVSLRAVPGAGTEVVTLPPDSPLATAGLREGDLVTRLGSAEAPTPGQVRAALAATSERGMLAAVTRDGSHLLRVIAP